MSWLNGALRGAKVFASFVTVVMKQICPLTGSNDLASHLIPDHISYCSTI
jgi:hypothetical protein